MKDLQKIIGLFIFIFVVGSAVIIYSINHKLEPKKQEEVITISKDSIDQIDKSKKII